MKRGRKEMLESQKKKSLHIVINPNLHQLILDVAEKTGMTISQTGETLLILGVEKSQEIQKKLHKEEKENEC